MSKLYNKPKGTHATAATKERPYQAPFKAAKQRMRAKGASIAGLKAKEATLNKQVETGLITKRERAQALNTYGQPKPKKKRASGGRGSLTSKSGIYRNRTKRL